MDSSYRPNDVQIKYSVFCNPNGFFCGAATQCGSWPPHSWGFLDHTQWRTKVGRTPLDEWSAHRRDLYLTTHNTHNRFEPTISTGERPQTYTLYHAATGTGNPNVTSYNVYWNFKNALFCIRTFNYESRNNFGGKSIIQSEDFQNSKKSDQNHHKFKNERLM